MISLSRGVYERLSRKPPYPIELVCDQCGTMQAGDGPSYFGQRAPALASAEAIDVLNRLMNRAAAIMGTTNATAQLVTNDFRHLEIVGQLNFKADFINCFQRVDRNSGTICGRAFLAREPVVVEDVLRDGASAKFINVFEEAKVRGVVSVPVIAPYGAFCGMVSTHRQRPHVPTSLQIADLMSAAQEAAGKIVSLRAGYPIGR